MVFNRIVPALLVSFIAFSPLGVSQDDPTEGFDIDGAEERRRVTPAERRRVPRLEQRTTGPGAAERFGAGVLEVRPDPRTLPFGYGVPGVNSGPTFFGAGIPGVDPIAVEDVVPGRRVTPEPPVGASVGGLPEAELEELDELRPVSGSRVPEESPLRRAASVADPVPAAERVSPAAARGAVAAPSPNFAAASDAFQFQSRDELLRRPVRFIQGLKDGDPIPNSFMEVKIYVEADGRPRVLGNDPLARSLDRALGSSYDLRRMNPADKILVEYFLKNGHPGVTQVLLNSSRPKVRQNALKRVRQAGNSGAPLVAAILSNNDGSIVPSPGQADYERRAANRMKAELRKHPRYRARIANQVLVAEGMPVRAAEVFPWDLNRRSDRSLLKEYLSDGQGVERRLADANARLAAASSDSSRARLAGEVAQLEDRVRVSREVLPGAMEQVFRNNDPLEFARVFPDYEPVALSQLQIDPNATGRPRFVGSGEAVGRMNALAAKAHGRRGRLNKGDRRLLELMVQRGSPDAVAALISGNGDAPDAVFRKLRKMGARGDAVLADILLNVDDTPARRVVVERIGQDAKLRERVRTAFMQEDLAPATLRMFPWDEANAGDRREMTRVVRGRKGGSRGRFRRKLNSVVEAIEKAGVSIPDSPISFAAERIPDEGLRREFIRARNDVFLADIAPSLGVPQRDGRRVLRSSGRAPGRLSRVAEVVSDVCGFRGRRVPARLQPRAP